MKKVPKSTRIRSLTNPALGVLLAGAFSLGAGGTASASEVGATARPTGCRYEVPGSWGAVASCKDDNGGSYRALAICKDPESGKTLWFYGTWRQSGFSYAFCQGSSQAVSAGIETSVRDNR
ncbi:hypothetical protein GCM10023237_15680 [Streptomyces coeruleoprunus]